jgi:hypothetical protein
MKKIPLELWLNDLRKQVSHATQKYLKDGMPEPAFLLNGIDIEATVETERTDGGKLAFDIVVLNGEIEDGQVSRFTQRVNFHFKLEGGEMMMGE